MAKTNFSKVEDLLETSLEKMELDKLGKLADIAQSVERPEMRKIVEKAALAATKSEIDKKALLHNIRRSLKQFKEPQFFEYIGISEEELEALLKNTKELKSQDWMRLQGIRQKINEFKKAKEEKNAAQEGNEAIVEKERHKHLNKRFNVKEKWLPLK